ncbi:MAG: hypothetical protein RIS70_4437, partial [Planctomycetota bacterium]
MTKATHPATPYETRVAIAAPCAPYGGINQ